MNNNFNLISENNKELRYLMGNLFHMVTHRKEYLNCFSDVEKNQIVKDFYREIFKNNDRDFQDLIILRPKSKILEELKNQVFEFEDRKGISWKFEIEGSKDLEEYLVFKGVYYNLIDKMEIDGLLQIKEDISMFKLYFSSVYKKIELVKQEVDQELIDLTLITEDIDISKLKGIGVKDIIYDVETLNEIVKNHFTKDSSSDIKEVNVPKPENKKRSPK